jgi:DNA-binding MarR family transcriptional regulator
MLDFALPNFGGKTSLEMPGESNKRWTFLTNHAAVLLHIAHHPEDSISSIADALGLSERATAGIIADLRAANYVTSRRVSRHNSYTINRNMPLRREYHAGHTVDDLLQALVLVTGDESLAEEREGEAVERQQR